MKIRYRWDGPDGPDDQMPMIGQLLASDRGRLAYRLLHVDNRGVRIHGETREAYTLLVLTVEHAPRAEMDIPGTVTHRICWDKRVKKARRLETLTGVADG
jgi:hypothetical protein